MVPLSVTHILSGPQLPQILLVLFCLVAFPWFLTFIGLGSWARRAGFVLVGLMIWGWVTFFLIGFEVGPYLRRLDAALTYMIFSSPVLVVPALIVLVSAVTAGSLGRRDEVARASEIKSWWRRHPRRVSLAGTNVVPFRSQASGTKDWTEPPCWPS